MSSQAPDAARGSEPSTRTPRKSRNVLLLGAPLADQILQGVAEQLLVAFGPGADVVDQPVGPGHGGSEAGKERRLRRSAEAGGCIERGRASAWNQGTAGCPGPVGFDGFRDRDLLGRVGSVSSGRFAIGRSWCRRDRAGLGRKAMLLDQGAQISFSGVLLPWPPADCVYSSSISFSSCFVLSLLRSISFASCFIRCSCSTMLCS